MNPKLYPLKFSPILKSVLWGGDKIAEFKNIQTPQPSIGESWEISSVEGDISVVSEGELKGTSLQTLLEMYKETLVGKKNYLRFGNQFPLLIKFIDARDDLSIQVHPNDELAQKRHQSFGKTEMWYVIHAEPQAKLYSGFKAPLEKEHYHQSIEDGTFLSHLCQHEVKPGDVFFLPAGRVHAIGTGIFIAEIQQTSNITYRIFDYNRKDSQGNTRELHIEPAKEAIDFSVYPDYRTHYTPQKNTPILLEQNKYFTTNLLEIDSNIQRNYQHIDSFIIYICTKGEVNIKTNDDSLVNLAQGETLLLPASTSSVTLSPQQHTTIIETYIE